MQTTTRQLKRLGLNGVYQYNDIPDSELPVMPEKGTVATFRMLEEILDPIGQPRGDRFHSPAPIKMVKGKSIPAYSSYYSKEKDAWVPLAFLSNLDRDGQPQASPEYREKLRGSNFVNGGGDYNIIIGANPVTDALYQYLMLASFVSGNNLTSTQRESGVKQFIGFIDRDKEARQRVKGVSKKMEAMKFLADNSENSKQIDQLCLVLGIPYRMSKAEKELALYEYADSNTDSFLRLTEDPSRITKAKFLEAIENNVLRIDAANKSVIWHDGNELMKVKSARPLEAADEYINWLKRDPNVASIDERIKKETDAAVKQYWASKNKKSEATVKND